MPGISRGFVDGSTGRPRSNSLSDEDGGCLLNDCVADDDGFLGACDGDSHSRILGIEATRHARATLCRLIVLGPWSDAEAGLSQGESHQGPRKYAEKRMSCSLYPWEDDGRILLEEKFDID
ncbi:hypothetical protein M419DRAFT_121031 [Trichoderma reesei RUT C-30]|uniref:Uncharacterized protein n=1 Tax=Hypocrea jecorina (strain ATCC 56765 / BCRC 32924 / NRRL 11460 / Rut C-30) TaxID=1344414 RepID=A0A024RWL5_HYPJR|nr:hypothetical protein M419DRAFT_121031 [Trichoderma reesei RUT C-30]